MRGREKSGRGEASEEGKKVAEGGRKQSGGRGGEMGSAPSRICESPEGVRSPDIHIRWVIGSASIRHCVVESPERG